MATFSFIFCKWWCGDSFVTSLRKLCWGCKYSTMHLQFCRQNILICVCILSRHVDVGVCDGPDCDIYRQDLRAQLGWRECLEPCVTAFCRWHSSVGFIGPWILKGTGVFFSRHENQHLRVWGRGFLPELMEFYLQVVGELWTQAKQLRHVGILFTSDRNTECRDFLFSSFCFTVDNLIWNTQWADAFETWYYTMTPRFSPPTPKVQWGMLFNTMQMFLRYKNWVL